MTKQLAVNLTNQLLLAFRPLSQLTSQYWSKSLPKDKQANKQSTNHNRALSTRQTIRFSDHLNAINKQQDTEHSVNR